LAGLAGACLGFPRDSYQVLPSREAVLTAFKKNPKLSFQLSALSRQLGACPPNIGLKADG
jgi:hypothetical protein